MTTSIIGRAQEQQELTKLYHSSRPEFIAVYGRRRVGKTFLVREFFENKFSFQFTGIANATTEEQLLNFNLTLRRYLKQEISIAKNWLEAFEQLIDYLDNCSDDRKVVFIDELPWLDTPRSSFIQALEHFWNGWASARNDMLLIVCGSATSWMTDKLINSHGGLYNRITSSIKLEPFTLSECEAYFKSRDIDLSRYQITECYMVMGGIPFYLSLVEKGLSIYQNIDRLFFSTNAKLRNEFYNLYASLFRNADNYIKVVETLSGKMKGLTRDEIASSSKIPSSGNLTIVLRNLESCGFIRSYTSFGKKQRNRLYQLIDAYTLFYYKFIKENTYNDDRFWTNSLDTPRHYSWAGYAFEIVCLHHIKEIKSSLGISGIVSNVSSWRSSHSDNGAQIDLLIDRKDQTISMCEMKFSGSEFEIDKSYEEVLKNKRFSFINETKTKKSVYLTMVTTYGIKQNKHAAIIQNQVTVDNLFNRSNAYSS